MSTIRMITQPQYPPECQPKERPPSTESTPKTSEGPTRPKAKGPKVRRSEGPSLPKVRCCRRSVAAEVGHLRTTLKPRSPTSPGSPGNPPNRGTSAPPSSPEAPLPGEPEATP